MGAWGTGPFDNDAAADFLGELDASPARGVTRALRAIAKAPAGKYLDVDDGGAAWAACELVAVAFGQTGDAALADDVVEVAARLRPDEAQRQLAIEVLPRLADRETSEVAQLWYEGDGGPGFAALLASLRARLEEAGKTGPRALVKARKGDVIALAAAPASRELVAVQVLGPREVAVVVGTFGDDAAALASVRAAPARRVPASANKLLGRGRLLGNTRLRKDLAAKKLYAGEAGAILDYALSGAGGAGLRIVTYDEAREADVLRAHGDEAIRAIALGKAPPPARVRSPDEREAELVTHHAERWAARRRETTPHPFGDVEQLTRFVEWIESFGLDNAVRRCCDIVSGASGYGRPNERSERDPYAFAALVAIWRGTWPRDAWPADLAGRLPAAPDDESMTQALEAARVLAADVITREAELRLIWKGAPDGGAALRASVAALQEALVESRKP